MARNASFYSFRIRSNDTKYEIDLKRLRQRNLRTLKQRAVRRVRGGSECVARRRRGLFVGAQSISKLSGESQSAATTSTPDQRQRRRQRPRSMLIAPAVRRQFVEDAVSNDNADGANGGGMHFRRSQTVGDGVAATVHSKHRGFERALKRQQKAIEFFNERHSKSRSMMSALPLRAQWQWRHDDGQWIPYSVDTAAAIERAFGGGHDAVDITENGVVYALRLDHDVQCHFATNKMVPIRRLQAHREMATAAATTTATDSLSADDRDDGIDHEFDALSNELENGDDGDPFGQSVEDEAVPTLRDSEAAPESDEYGDEYNEYIERFNRLKAE